MAEVGDKLVDIKSLKVVIEALVKAILDAVTMMIDSELANMLDSKLADIPKGNVNVVRESTHHTDYTKDTLEFVTDSTGKVINVYFIRK